MHLPFYSAKVRSFPIYAAAFRTSLKGAAGAKDPIWYPGDDFIAENRHYWLVAQDASAEEQRFIGLESGLLEHFRELLQSVLRADNYISGSSLAGHGGNKDPERTRRLGARKCSIVSQDTQPLDEPPKHAVHIKGGNALECAGNSFNHVFATRPRDFMGSAASSSPKSSGKSSEGGWVAVQK